MRELMDGILTGIVLITALVGATLTVAGIAAFLRTVLGL